MQKLVCDRCGFELTEKDDIFLALDGSDAWVMACRARGENARGLFPCKFYFQCKGQMILLTAKEEKKLKKGLFGRGKQDAP